MRSAPPSRSRHALVDTAAHFAFIDRHDQDHAWALVIRDRLVTQRWRLFTTSFILAETHALLLNRLNRRVATAFLREMEESTTTVRWVSPADVKRARDIIYHYNDKEFSLTDACSFAVMEGLGITTAYTFDDHFTQFGLTVLTPDNF